MSAAASLPLFPNFFTNSLAETDPEIAEAIGTSSAGSSTRSN